MATSQEIALAIDELRNIIDPMHWNIVATDLRGDDVVLQVTRAKSSIGAGGSVPAPEAPSTQPAGTQAGS